MYHSSNVEEEVWELRERAAQLELDLVRTQRQLRDLELQLAQSQPTSYSQPSRQQYPAQEFSAPAATVQPVRQRTSDIPEFDLKPLSMEDRMEVVRSYADRFKENYSQRDIAAALRISTSTYNNMLAGRGIYTKYDTRSRNSSESAEQE